MSMYYRSHLLYRLIADHVTTVRVTVYLRRHINIKLYLLMK